VNTNLSIQESLYPELTCFGCSHANPHGFHLRSYREGDLTVAEFKPSPDHDNGFGFVNGGIIATVLDCHGAAAVMWEVAQRGWIDPTGRPVPFLTASFEVTFHRPTPPRSLRTAQCLAREHRPVPPHRQSRDVGRRQGEGYHDSVLGSRPLALTRRFRRLLQTVVISCSAMSRSVRRRPEPQPSGPFRWSVDAARIEPATSCL
jgi:acyl-coenzyme A thioesterase PaaI-like protein